MDKAYSKYYWRYRDGEMVAIWDGCYENKNLYRKEKKRRKMRMLKIKAIYKGDNNFNI